MGNVESLQKTNGEDLNQSDLPVVEKREAKREVKREATLTGKLVENGRYRAPNVMEFSRSLERITDTKLDPVGDDAAAFESVEADEVGSDNLTLFLKCCIVFLASAAISTLLL